MGRTGIWVAKGKRIEVSAHFDRGRGRRVPQGEGVCLNLWPSVGKLGGWLKLPPTGFGGW